MARPLRNRIFRRTVPCTSRGDRREAIYLSDADRQYWLDLLGQVCTRHNWLCHAYCLMDNHFHIATGTSITLSADAAGWGWFVDTTPAQNEEFDQLGNSQEYVAQADSAAAGKIDLLGVLIHEIGHALGLGHSDDAHDEMAATVSPGLRRLPDMEAGVFATGIGQTVHAAMTVSYAQSPKTVQYITAVNPTLANGNFISGLSAWESHGRVRFDASAGQHTINLGESTSAQAHVGQAFVLSAQDRFLTFTVSGLNLQTNSIEQGGVFTTAPQDAFEVTLQNANTGTNLLADATGNHDSQAAGQRG